MSQNIRTDQFWNGIDDYSGNPMTYTEADFELSGVYACINPNQDEQIKDLFCMGIADGMREPISILKDIRNKGGEPPSRLIVNDISTNLLAQAKSNILKDGWVNGEDNRITYFCGKIHEINEEPLVKTTKSRLGVIGVYNLGYFKNALHLYKHESHIVGTQFHVYPVYLNTDEGNFVLEYGNTIEFDISELNDDIINQINNNVDQNKQLYAQCVYTTDKQFVSHYFNRIQLEKVIRNVFIGYDITIEQEGDNKRYLLVKVLCIKPTGNGMTLLTSLNNVLGNIATDAQISSLKVFKRLID